MSTLYLAPSVQMPMPPPPALVTAAAPQEDWEQCQAMAYLHACMGLPKPKDVSLPRGNPFVPPDEHGGLSLEFLAAFGDPGATWAAEQKITTLTQTSTCANYITRFHTLAMELD
ncbi:Retrotransposon gag protein [Rhizoctonia solani]|uniref:Retrotransposon gag protein n=1 Tax=Rhizoctonia solani TaxID=456999 RepID=A0A8H8P4R3_9AGAM|nr:Retrotransposon gag protein [Rhizoctonia solani]XP_043185367.1 Retrotransposon gag protein [Rhizoctonia solani]QRW24131.1 Retrotransposon gag protein [Rhizoctonia solani]QRW25130.1 Retrotransposon gag protein [Rhizoctonia solani]